MGSVLVMNRLATNCMVNHVTINGERGISSDILNNWDQSFVLRQSYDIHWSDQSLDADECTENERSARQ